MGYLRSFNTLPLLVVLAACADDPIGTSSRDPVAETPSVLGVYEFTFSGIATSEMRASAAPVPHEPDLALNPISGSLGFEHASSGTFTEGVRGSGGHRYLYFTYRVRNATGASLKNVTIIPASTSTTTIAGTPFVALSRADGTAADTAMAKHIVPTGGVRLDMNLTMRAFEVDVLQVYTEAEVAAVQLPAGVTGLFPYGFMVRNASTASGRTLQPATGANDFGGVFIFAFRLPLAATAAEDIQNISIRVLAIQDTETRLTESIEDGQDSSAVRRLRERAIALGATSVTVLNGSPAAEFSVGAYPGQRQVCGVRTAGTAASPVTFINHPAAYTRIAVLRPGESRNACTAYFRSGTPTLAQPGSPYYVTVAAMDRYGNVLPAVADTVRLESIAGPGGDIGGPAALVNGQGTIPLMYGNYGTSFLRAVGRRNRGEQQVDVGAPYVALYAGDWQTAMAGTAVPIRPAVMVLDHLGNPLPGRTVAFAATGGGGTVYGGVATTDANGVATVGNWFMGPVAELNTLIATTSGAAVNNNDVRFDAAGCAGGGGTNYAITLCITTATTAAQRTAIANAVTRWQGLVIGDLPNVAFNRASGACGTNSPALNLTVDDLLIFAGVQSIDGPGGTLAASTPCFVRGTQATSVVGRMHFDDADITALESAGQLESVARHEIGHVLGVGTLWTRFDLLQNPSSVGGPGLDTYYSGYDGITGFEAIGGTTYTGGEKVPVENTGGAGTINSHWRESVLGAELMTGYLDAGSNALSELTVRSLGDLGYTVYAEGADPFFLAMALRREEAADGPGIHLGNDVLPGPIERVDEQGSTLARLR